jgi:hypothetical protein
LTEVSVEHAFASTTTHYRFDYGGFVNEYDREEITNRVLWTVGPMFNTGPSRAIGGTISAGFASEGTRLALEGRRRWWMGNLSNSVALDLSAGLVRLRVPPLQSGGSANAYGVTTGAYVVGGDLIQINARLDVVRSNGRLRGGGTVGAGLGSYGAVGATAIAGALWIAALVAIATSGGDF